MKKTTKKSTQKEWNDFFNEVVMVVDLECDDIEIDPELPF